MVRIAERVLDAGTVRVVHPIEDLDPFVRGVAGLRRDLERVTVIAVDGELLVLGGTRPAREPLRVHHLLGELFGFDELQIPRCRATADLDRLGLRQVVPDRANAHVVAPRR